MTRAASEIHSGPVSPFIWPIRVYWEDTDAGGVVYHASYLRFLERARSEWMRSLGYAQQTLREREDMVFVVRSMRLEFLRAARLDDELNVGVMLEALRPASLLLAQTIRRGGETLLTAEVKVACVTASNFRPCAVPVVLAADLKKEKKEKGSE